MDGERLGANHMVVLDRWATFILTNRRTGVLECPLALRFL